MEPFITSTLSVAQKIPTKQLSGLTTGVVIHSKVGPITPTKVTSPREFLNLYTINKSLSRGDHPSLLNAYFLSRFSDLVVVRSTNVTTYPLVAMEPSSSVDSVLLGSGQISDKVDIITPTLPDPSADINSLILQIDDVLFYGSNGVGPFENGDGLPGGTATRRVKGTEDSQLTAEGLGTSASWNSVKLSVPLVTDVSPFTVNPAALTEIAEAFKMGGSITKTNLHVVKVGSTLKVYYSSEFPVLNENFMPKDRGLSGVEDPSDTPIINISNVTSTVTTPNTYPYFIGTRNVGTVNTLKAWVTDVTSKTVGSETYQNWTLHLEDSVNGELTYLVSSNPDELDSSGNPIYYTWIEDIRPDIIYRKNKYSTANVINTIAGSNNVGRSQEFIDSTSDSTKLLNNAKLAAFSLEDYTEDRIHLFTDAGWYNKTIAKAFESISSTTKSLTCVGINPSIKDKNQIKLYASGFNSYYSIIHVGAGKDTSATGFLTDISPSCYFIEAIARNKTRGNTYAPVFSKTNGATSEPRISTSFNKTQRDELTEARVNVIMYDDVDAVSYINNNLLTDSSKSLIDEDQSIRIINDIQYDINRLMEPFISQFNMDETRDRVTSTLDNYFKTQWMSQRYSISDYSVECSEVNNTEINVQNNELKVDVFIKLNHSIKFITVATNVVPTI